MEPQEQSTENGEENPIDVFNSLLTKHKLLIVNFSASWCGPCKNVEPFVSELCAKMSSDIAFLKLDLDEHEELADHLEVSKVPTFFSFVNGEKTETVQGAKPELIQKLFDKTETHCLFG